jgi:ubiquinone/menaquinone biosynthesis C-methylase UbiE
MNNDASEWDVERFDRWADTYDRSMMQRLLMAPLHQLTIKQATATRPAPASILDIGCGTGQLLRRTARRFPQAHMTGIDASEDMVRVAQALVPEGALLRFVHAVAEQMPFDDGAFDVVVTTLSFHHWEDQPMALREVRRVLSPGGTFALVDALAVGMLRGRLTRSQHGRFYTPQVLEGMLRQAGFDVERFVPVLRFAGVVQVILSRPVGDTLSQVPEPAGG